MSADVPEKSETGMIRKMIAIWIVELLGLLKTSFTVKPQQGQDSDKSLAFNFFLLLILLNSNSFQSRYPLTLSLTRIAKGMPD